MARRSTSEANTFVTAAVPVIRFGLILDEAAEAVGIGKSLFQQMVADGRMPRPRMMNSRRVWDIDELRAAFKRLPHDGPEIIPSDDDDKWGRVVP